VLVTETTNAHHAALEATGLCQSKKQVGLCLFKVAHFSRDRICFEAENLVCFQGLLAAEEVKSKLLQGGGWNAAKFARPCC
jgi:hypothetical protein